MTPDYYDQNLDDLAFNCPQQAHRKFARTSPKDDVERCDHLCGSVFGLDGGTDAAKGIQRHSRALQSTRAD